MFNFHFLLGTHSCDDALVKECKDSTIFKHYHSLLKNNLVEQSKVKKGRGYNTLS